MRGEDDDLLDDDFDDDTSDFDDEVESAAPAVSIDARRRIEDRLEELRLKRLMDDYSFDLG